MPVEDEPPFRRAMLLAAGLGTRMRPLTDTQPKPLIEVAGRSLADHVLDRLEAAGVDRVVVNVHHLAEQVERHLASRVRPAVAISDERSGLLDSGGGVAKALPMLGAAPFVICNADSFWIDGPEPALPAMMRTWDAERMDMMMLLARIATSTGFSGLGDYNRDEATGRLARRVGADSVPYAYAGVLLAKPELFGDRPARFSLNSLFDEAEARGRLVGHVLNGTWLHVGTPAAIGEAEARIAELSRVRLGDVSSTAA